MQHEYSERGILLVTSSVGHRTSTDPGLEVVDPSDVNAREKLLRSFDYDGEYTLDVAIVLDEMSSVSAALSLLRLMIQIEPVEKRLAIIAVGDPPPLAELISPPDRNTVVRLLASNALILVCNSGAREWTSALIAQIFDIRGRDNDSRSTSVGWWQDFDSVIADI